MGRKTFGSDAAVLTAEQPHIELAPVDKMQVEIAGAAVTGGQVFKQHRIKEAPQQRISLQEVAQGQAFAHQPLPHAVTANTGSGTAIGCATLKNLKIDEIKFQPMKKSIVFGFLFTAAAIAIDAGAAKAVLVYNISESLGNLVVETSGSLNLPGSAGTGNCGAAGAIAPTLGFMCTGPDVTTPTYSISGPTAFTGTSDLYPATSVSGLITGIVAGIGRFVMDPTYVSGTPIVSGAIYSGKTLADLGLTPSSGTLGTWTLAGTGDTISINVVNPVNSVPGPLPVLAAGVGFGFSRKLRQRIKSRQVSAHN